MYYAMLICMDEKRFADLPKEEQNRVHRECGAWHEELVKSGHSRGATVPRPPSRLLRGVTADDSPRSLRSGRIRLDLRNLTKAGVDSASVGGASVVG
jgi:hypothetical protein